MKSGEVARRAREVRIGLVMYGGVSLAIYMNGVANELHRAVRGRGVYRLFKAITDSDVVVDVVSGASAGGINGMFLAYALCNELEFETCADLWRKQGDISQLLRRLDSPREAQTSLLDSEGYYEPQLARAFRAMWDQPAPPDASNSKVEELDLFVAGTEFNGRRTTNVDSAGHVIDVKDHRTTFWLKHREDRKRQLHPAADARGLGAPDSLATTPALDPALRSRVETGFAAFAKLARITSCFPAAFAPVALEVPAPGATELGPELEIGRKLGVWGALKPDRYHFLDGGILDNKPFTSTIEAIFYRMANRPVQRHLIYVEPDPERFRDDRPRAPTFLSAAVDSLTRLPAYESIANDLKLIAKHNDSVERYTRTCAELRDTVMMQPPGDLGRDRGPARTIYERIRLQALGELAVSRIMNADSAEIGVGNTPSERMTELRRAFDRAIEQERGSSQRWFADLDVEFRLRRMLHLTYMLLPETESHDVSVDRRSQRPERVAAPRPARLLSPADVRIALDAIGRQIALLEIVRAQMLNAIERCMSGLGAGEVEVWAHVTEVLSALLDVEGLDAGLCDSIVGGEMSEESLIELQRVLEQRCKVLGNGAASSRSGARVSLLALTDRGERALARRFPLAAGVALPKALAGAAEFLPIGHEYERFEALDSMLFPMQFVADLRERDVIRTVRVSPLDAQRGLSRGDYADKVTGEALAHFGAFLKRSWRTNDILCGRLDGSCQLLETLLNVSFLRTALGKREQREAALDALGVAEKDQREGAARRAAIGARLREQAIFPGAGDEAIDRAAAALATLLDPATESSFEARVTGRPYQELLDALVEATHLSILSTEYRHLIDDSVEEQLEWRTGPVRKDLVPTDAPSKAPEFDPAVRAFDTKLDDLALVAAARQFSKQAQAGKLAPRELRELYGAYSVGAESLERHVPRTVLLELCARTLLIARNCVLSSLAPARAAAIRGSNAYRLFIDWPLLTFHAFASRLRERPAETTFLLGLLGYAALGGVVNLAFRGEAWPKEGWRGFALCLLFVATPLACVATLAVLLASGAYGREGKGAWIAAIVRGAFRVVGVVAGALLAGAIFRALSFGFSPAVSSFACKHIEVLGDSCKVTGEALLVGLSLACGVVLGAALMRRYRGALHGRLRRALDQSKFGPTEVGLLFKRVLNHSHPARGALAQQKTELLRQAQREERLQLLEREMQMLRPDAF